MKQSETLAEGCTGSSADSPYKQLIEPRKTCLTKIFCTFNPSSPVIAQQRSLVDLQDNDDKISIGIRPYQVDIDISLPSGQIVSMSIVSSLTIRQVRILSCISVWNDEVYAQNIRDNSLFLIYKAETFRVQLCLMNFVGQATGMGQVFSTVV